MNDLAALSATQLCDLLNRSEISSVDLMKAVLERIEARENQVQAYLTLRNPAELINEADTIDKRRASGGKLGRLAGIPVAVKDNLCTSFMRTTAASRMLENYTPPYDATVVKKIREEDGIIIGKTNLDEFSMGSSTENSAFKTTTNPHNPDYVPGGTSGGSAAAVGANEAILAIGSDTGGSIRQPAAFCGVVGMKPTYGRVSRFGLLAYGSSLDQVGPITKSVADARLLLSVIAGTDAKDATSSTKDVPDYLNYIETADPIRFGIPSSFLSNGLDAEMAALFASTLASLQQLGHEIVEIDLPHSRYALSAYYVLACAEASTNLSRYDGVAFGHRSREGSTLSKLFKKSRSEGFGPEVKRRIMLGTYVLSSGYYEAYYDKASRVRSLVRNDYQLALEQCDVIINPVSPVPPFKLGEKIENPLSMYLADVYTVPANLTGYPAISVPAGTTKNGMPVGVQLTAGYFEETKLFEAAHQLENCAR